MNSTAIVFPQWPVHIDLISPDYSSQGQSNKLKGTGKMTLRTRSALLCLLLVIPLTLGSCTSKDASPEPPSEQEQLEEIERAVHKWVDENVDELAEQIGPLLTGNLPLLRDVASELIKKGLLAWLDVKILKITTIENEHMYSARAELEFPIVAKLPLLGEKRYSVSVQYDLIIENGEVTDADIDVTSFDWKQE